jgi:hypothetical protein
VDETLSDILNSVVNSNIVGKVDILRTSGEKSALNRTIIAIDMLKATSISSSHDGIGIMKNIMIAKV